MRRVASTTGPRGAHARPASCRSTRDRSRKGGEVTEMLSREHEVVERRVPAPPARVSAFSRSARRKIESPSGSPEETARSRDSPTTRNARNSTLHLLDCRHKSSSRKMSALTRHQSGPWRLIHQGERAVECAECLVRFAPLHRHVPLCRLERPARHRPRCRRERSELRDRARASFRSRFAGCHRCGRETASES